MDMFSEHIETLKEALLTLYNEWSITSVERSELEELFHAVYENDPSDIICSLSDSLNFTEENMRRFYVFRYMIPHVLCVCSGLENALLSSSNFITWLRRKKSHKLSICSFGGGPGTELFSFKFFFQKLQTVFKNPEAEPELYNDLKTTGLFRWSATKMTHMPVIASAEVLEKYTFWEPTFQRINEEIFLPIPIPKVSYSEYDFGIGFADDDSDPRLERLKESDVVTMVMFCSSVLCSESIGYNIVEHRLKQIIGNLKSDALLIFCDVNCPDILKLFNEAVKGMNLQQIFNDEIISENPKINFGEIFLPNSTRMRFIIWRKR